MSSYDQVKADSGNDQFYSPPYGPAPGYQASPYYPPPQTINVPIVETSEGGNRRRQKDDNDDSNEDDSPMIPSKYLDVSLSCFVIFYLFQCSWNLRLVFGSTKVLVQFLRFIKFLV